MSYFEFVQALHQGLSWSHAVYLVARKLNYKNDVLVLSFDTTCDWGKVCVLRNWSKFSPFSWNGREYRDQFKITESIYSFVLGGSHYLKMMRKPRSKVTKHNLIYCRLNWLKVSQFDEILSVIDEANDVLK